MQGGLTRLEIFQGKRASLGRVVKEEEELGEPTRAYPRKHPRVDFPRNRSCGRGAGLAWHVLPVPPHCTDSGDLQLR